MFSSSKKCVYFILILRAMTLDVNGQIIAQTDQQYTGNQPLTQDFRRGIGFSKRNDIIQYYSDAHRNSPSTFQSRTLSDNINPIIADSPSRQRGTSLNRFNGDDMFRNHRTPDRRLTDNSRHKNNKFSRQGTSIVFLSNRNKADTVSKGIVLKAGSGSSSRGLILKTGSGTKIHLNGGPSGRSIIIEHGGSNRNSRIHNNNRNDGLKTVDQFSGTSLNSNLDERFTSHGRHRSFHSDDTFTNRNSALSSTKNSFPTETALQNNVLDTRHDQSFYPRQTNTDTQRFSDRLRQESTDTTTRFKDRLFPKNHGQGIQNINSSPLENNKLAFHQQVITDTNTGLHDQGFSDGLSQNFKDTRTDFLDRRFLDRRIQGLEDSRSGFTDNSFPSSQGQDITNLQTNFMDNHIQRSGILDQRQAENHEYSNMNPSIQENIRFSEIRGRDVKNLKTPLFTDSNFQNDFSSRLPSADMSLTQTQIENLVHSGLPSIPGQNRRKIAGLLHGLIQTLKSNSNHQIGNEPLKAGPVLDQGVSANMPTHVDIHRQNANINVNSGPFVSHSSATAMGAGISPASKTDINTDLNKRPTASENLISKTDNSNSETLSRYVILAKNEPIWKELEALLASRKFKIQKQIDNENAKSLNRVKVKIVTKTKLPSQVSSNIKQPKTNLDQNLITKTENSQFVKDPNTNSIIPTVEIKNIVQNSYMSDKHKNINNKKSDKQLSINKTDIRTTTSADPNPGHVIPAVAAGNHAMITTAKPAMTDNHVITKIVDSVQVEVTPQQETTPQKTAKPTTSPMYEIETEEPELPEAP